MEKINILNKIGMISDEDRNHKIIHSCFNLSFETCIDLSVPIKVKMIGNSKIISIENYSRDVSSFIVWWTLNVLKDLNGFSGFNNVKYELVDFQIV